MNIRIQGLQKQYKQGVKALKGIDLDIGPGIFGLLGPNGAGKTTLIRILVTLLEPTAGSIRFGDYDLRKNRSDVRSLLGYLPQHFSTFSKLTTWEFLDYAAQLAGIRRRGARKQAVERMLETVGLYEVRDRQSNKLSGGMKRRLGIAQALIGDPKVLIVDEPTIGLDPEERLRFRNLLVDMSHQDIIVILSTHIVGDISSSCSGMAVLNSGEVVCHAAPDEFIEMARGHVWLLRISDSDLNRIKDKYPVVSTIPAKNGWEVQVVGENLEHFDGELIEPNLEHAYIHFLESTLGDYWYDDYDEVAV